MSFSLLSVRKMVFTIPESSRLPIDFQKSLQYSSQHERSGNFACYYNSNQGRRKFISSSYGKFTEFFTVVLKKGSKVFQFASYLFTGYLINRNILFDRKRCRHPRRLTDAAHTGHDPDTAVQCVIHRDRTASH